MKVGVLDIQGDVTEHLDAVSLASESLGIDVEAVAVRTAKKVLSVRALIIPGGESTTVSYLMSRFGMDDAVLRAAKNIPVFGTCAGMVLICKNVLGLAPGQKTLGLMDATVSRNAWGRQADSFEADIDIPLLGRKPYPGVFIRAPAIEEVSGVCESLSSYAGKTVLARQGNLLASAFHPELTGDLRLHEMFLRMI